MYHECIDRHIQYNSTCELKGFVIGSRNGSRRMKITKFKQHVIRNILNVYNERTLLISKRICKMYTEIKYENVCTLSCAFCVHGNS